MKTETEAYLSKYSNCQLRLSLLGSGIARSFCKSDGFAFFKTKDLCLRGIKICSFGTGRKESGFKPGKVSQKYLNQYGEHKLCHYLVIFCSSGIKWHVLLLALIRAELCPF